MTNEWRRNGSTWVKLGSVKFTPAKEEKTNRFVSLGGGVKIQLRFWNINAGSVGISYLREMSYRHVRYLVRYCARPVSFFFFVMAVLEEEEEQQQQK